MACRAHIPVRKSQKLSFSLYCNIQKITCIGLGISDENPVLPADRRGILEDSHDGFTVDGEKAVLVPTTNRAKKTLFFIIKW
jgi:hypothetical protein